MQTGTELIFTRADSAGFTLVELLIAMALGLSLSAGVMQIYVANSQADRIQEAKMRIQETGRFALNFLASEIRMSAYLGCLSKSGIIHNMLYQPPASFQVERGIQGWEAKSVTAQELVSSSGSHWTSTEGNVLDTTTVMTGTDILRVWNTSPGAALLDSISSGAEANGDIVILNDCYRVDVLQACSVVHSSEGLGINTEATVCVPGNDVSKPARSQIDGELLKLKSALFYIGKRANVAENPPALFRRQLNSNAVAGTPEEMLEGIENMQILYGVNLDNDLQNTVDAYVPADQVSAWSSVISVRLSLLVQSIENNLAVGPQSYAFDGVLYDGAAGNGSLPSDRRFVATVTLRNRALAQ
jgi:type IV pilus assembly protein PilW